MRAALADHGGAGGGPCRGRSHTQRELWKTDKARYKGLYFDNRAELRVSNSGQEYGKVVADALEKGVDTGDLLTDSATLLLPKYDTADQLIEVDVKTKDGWLCLVAKPDTLDSRTFAFREYKTGKGEWTLAKAIAHPQMIFYAVVIWQKYGVMLDKAHLDWIETEWVKPDNESVARIRPTGRVESFEVPFTPVQHYETLADMIKVAKEVELAWASHVTSDKPIF